MDIIATVTTAILAAFVAALLVCATAARRVADLREALDKTRADRDTALDTVAAKGERIRLLEAQVQSLSRYRGWKGVYTNARGERVNVTGLVGYRCGGTEYVIVEPTNVPGRTPYPVKRTGVEWVG